MRDNIEKVLTSTPRHFRKMVILLGIREMCKSLQTYDLEEIVNKYNLSAGYFKHLVDEVTQDTSFDHVVTGELYQELVKLQLWFKERKNSYQGIYEFGSMYDRWNEILTEQLRQIEERKE